DEPSCLLGRLGEDDATELDTLVARFIRLLLISGPAGDDTEGASPDRAETADQGLAVSGTVPARLRTSDDTRHSRLDIARLSDIGLENAVQLFRRISWSRSLGDAIEGRARTGPHFLDQRPNPLQA